HVSCLASLHIILELFTNKIKLLLFFIISRLYAKMDSLPVRTRRCFHKARDLDYYGLIWCNLLGNFNTLPKEIIT
ncbi:MAG: hypothetical protein ABR985_19885, partial [Methanotrichaceae archaeon]